MELIQYIVDFFKDPLCTLKIIIQIYGIQIYTFLFLVIFLETGFIIMPFLPGDSLLLAIGIIASGTGAIKITYIIPLMVFATFLGDNLNYFIGNKFGEYIQSRKKFFFLKREYIEITKKYFQNNGAKIIIISRFIPIIRTVTPFVAGINKMKYQVYLFYSIIGSLIWINSILLIGYFLGTSSWVQSNFIKVFLGILFFSIILIFLKLFKKK